MTLRAKKRRCVNMDADATNSNARVCFDEYGFAIRKKGEEKEDSHRCHLYSPQHRGSAITDKWREVCENWSHHDKCSPEQLRQLLRKGIPSELRSRVWQLFLNCQAMKTQSSFDYESSLTQLHSQLKAAGISDHCSPADVQQIHKILDRSVEVVNREPEGSGGHDDDELMKVDFEWTKTTRQIMMDVIRTFPDHHLFIGNTPKKQALFRILMLCSKYNPSVGYCQGMAYVAALLLMYMTEQDAFWALISLLERPKYLSGYYDPSMGRIKTHAEVFALLLKEKHPKVASHLEGLGVHPLMFVTSWFLCLFTTLPCWDTTLTICDLIFLEGVNTIFRAALSIIEVCTSELMAMEDLSTVLPFLQHPPSRLVSHKSFSRVLWQTDVQSWEVELYQDQVLRESSNPPRRLKRPLRERDDEESNESGLQPRRVKRPRRNDPGNVSVVDTPSNPSLLSRIMNALTPARSSSVKHPNPSSVSTTGSTSRQVTQQSSSENQPSYGHSYRKRSPMKKGRGYSPWFRTPSNTAQTSASQRRAKVSLSTRKSPQHQSGTDSTGVNSEWNQNEVELQEFSTIQKSAHQPQSVQTAPDDSTYTSSSLCVSPTLGSTPVSDLTATEPVARAKDDIVDSLQFSLTPELTASPVRRSVRIAKRRSSLRSKQSGLPTSNILSPLSDRPLQDCMQTPRNASAFRIFSTPVSLASNTKHCHSNTSHTPVDHSSGTSQVVSPEVELRGRRKRRREQDTCSPV